MVFEQRISNREVSSKMILNREYQIEKCLTETYRIVINICMKISLEKSKQHIIITISKN